MKKLDLLSILRFISSDQVTLIYDSCSSFSLTRACNHPASIRYGTQSRPSQVVDGEARFAGRYRATTLNERAHLLRDPECSGIVNIVTLELIGTAEQEIIYRGGRGYQ